jgi:hypothetical protein
MNMSFGRLLAAGRSLVGLRNGESRYREDKRVRLPKFISPKNPFASAEKNNEPPLVETAKPVAVSPPAIEKPAALKVQSALASTQRVTWLDGLRGKFNPFGSRGSTAKSTKGGAAGVARQGELALERVQVVRNDLSDAECKVESPPSKAVPGLPVMSMTMGKFEPVGAAWNRLAAKFIGTDQT